MNKTYTLKELADIGQMAAHMNLNGRSAMYLNPDGPYFENDRPAREAFTKAILDAIGYELPKDAEREAFDAWYQSAQIPQGETQAFAAWKAGREELRRLMEPSVCAANPDAKPKEPAWIPWNGGECPLPDTVKRWEYKMRNGMRSGKCVIIDGEDQMTEYWHHSNLPGDIIAYRVWE